MFLLLLLICILLFCGLVTVTSIIPIKILLQLHSLIYLAFCDVVTTWWRWLCGVKYISMAQCKKKPLYFYFPSLVFFCLFYLCRDKVPVQIISPKYTKLRDWHHGVSARVLNVQWSTFFYVYFLYFLNFLWLSFSMLHCKGNILRSPLLFIFAFTAWEWHILLLITNVLIRSERYQSEMFTNLKTLTSNIISSFLVSWHLISYTDVAKCSS